MSQDECGAGDVPDLARACGDMPEGAPAACEQGEPAFAQAAQGTLEGVAGAVTDVKFPAAGWLPDRDENAQAGALVAGIGEGGQSRYVAGTVAGSIVTVMLGNCRGIWLSLRKANRWLTYRAGRWWTRNWGLHPALLAFSGLPPSSMVEHRPLLA
jgi:hypothetical protein